MKKYFALILLSLFILGCAQQVDATLIAKQNEQVKQILSEYPNADLRAIYISADGVDSVKDAFFEACEFKVPAKNLYKITIKDESNNLDAVTWIDADAQKVLCVFRKGSKATSTPSPSPTNVPRATARPTITPTEAIRPTARPSKAPDVTTTPTTVPGVRPTASPQPVNAEPTPTRYLWCGVGTKIENGKCASQENDGLTFTKINSLWGSKERTTNDQPDAFEPDSSQETAKPIAVNAVAQAHNNHVKGDVDWVRFDAVTGSSYNLMMKAMAESTSVRADLYNSAGKQLKEDVVGTNADPEVVHSQPFTPSANGTYYLKISAFNYKDQIGDASEYKLLIIDGTAGTGDVFEADGDMEHAKEIVITSQSQLHNMHVSGDVDWVRFDAVTGSSYNLMLKAMAERTSVRADLYNSAGKLVKGDIVGTNADPEKVHTTVFAPTANGTYYLKISAFNYKDQIGDDSLYALMVSDGTKGSGDDFEPDSDQANAKPIAVNAAAQLRNMHVSGDVDWVQFNGVAGEAYNLAMKAMAERTSVNADLYDSSGKRLKENFIGTNADQGKTHSQQFTPSVNGTYYLRITAFNYKTAVGVDSQYSLQIVK